MSEMTAARVAEIEALYEFNEWKPDWQMHKHAGEIIAALKEAVVLLGVSRNLSRVMASGTDEFLKRYEGLTP